MQPTATSVRFFINSTHTPAVAHYQVNGGGQLNVSMNLSGSMHVLDLTGLKAGDQITYFLTYNMGTGARDSSSASFTVGNVSPTPTPTPTGTQVPTPTPTATPVQLAEVAIADGVLVAGAGAQKPGYTLYVFDQDSNGTSSCYGGCATNWPPLLVTDGRASGAPGLGSTTRSDGSIQATYNSRPLYYFINDTQVGDANGNGQGNVWWVIEIEQGDIVPLYSPSTQLAPVPSYVRNDGVIVTRLADRGRDRHAKDHTVQDHYDHYLAQYWEFRTARIQLEDFVPTGRSLIRVTFITEWQLDAREFRAWYAGDTGTPGRFFFNPSRETIQLLGSGTYNNNFEKISDSGHQYMYTVDITARESSGSVLNTIRVGDRMEFELSQFLTPPPGGGRQNYYGTTFLYLVGQPGVHPFEWQPGTTDGTKIPEAGAIGGGTTLGYNYSNEPAGRFMGMATNLAPENGQVFVEGRRLHHTHFVDGTHDERVYGAQTNPVWTAQIGKAAGNYINESCSSCHVRNGRALLPKVGEALEKWAVKVGDENGEPDRHLGRTLQPRREGSGNTEGDVTLASWTDHGNGLRSPNYEFSNGTPSQFSARIAPQLVGLGLLEAIDEATILEWADQDDANRDGISGRAATVVDPVTGETRLGRFGYKAAQASVKYQVAAAFNADMGVMTSIFPEPDCGSQQASCIKANSRVSDSDLEKLTKYIQLLGVPARRDYAVKTGENLFAEIGCADCHRPKMTTSEFHPLAELRNQTIYPYSDMLLHDMGPGLADSLGEGSASGSEWRTAPLWGLGHAKDVMLGDIKANDDVTIGQHLANGANREAGRAALVPFVGYLHDGRARTIDEAIRWHGGEAEASKNRYVALTQSNKDALLRFLESL